MMETQLTFIHMTDIHIQPLDKGDYMGVDTYQNVLNVLDNVRELGLKPACFVISGDLVNNGEVEAYERVKTLLDAFDDFGVPVLLALGNHDSRESFQQVILGETDTDEDRRYYHSHIFNEHKIIVLDSRVSGKVYGDFDAPQLAWLNEELADNLPTILIFHHPPLATPLALLDDHLLLPESANQLAEVITGKNVIGMLNGHIHFNNFGAFHGVPTLAGGHVAFMLDAHEADGMKFINGSGFNVITVKDQTFIINPVILPGEQTVLHHIRRDQYASLVAEHTS